jgi:hypothetical protein
VKKTWWGFLLAILLAVLGVTFLIKTDEILVATNELSSEKFIAKITFQDGRYMDTPEVPVFENTPLGLTPEGLRKLAFRPELEKVLPARYPPEEKWIEVDLSDQRLYAHEGNGTVYSFLISSGKRWTPTVKGEFRVWIKLRYSHMRGGSRERGDYYFLPNVPYVMYFYRGYGIHGTYWHNNFGTPMSHGCVNLSISDAEKLFWWANPVLSSDGWTVLSTAENPGTRVVIHD